MNDFARQNIEKDLDSLARSVFDIVDRGYMELLQQYGVQDLVARRLSQVDSMDAIEKYVAGKNDQILIYGHQNGEIILAAYF